MRYRSKRISALAKYALPFMLAAPSVGMSDYFLADGVTLVEGEPVLIPRDANVGTFEGGPTGTVADARINIAVPESVQRGGGGYNIPTGANPSPMYGVQPFTQKMLRFEEFGPEPLPAEGDIVPGGSLPPPVNYQSGPDGVALDTFLAQDINPYPVRVSNTADTNPWETDIESFIGRDLVAPPAEGRPPGELWSHQRWGEFYPEAYYQTAQAGARTNGGLRDSKQMHGYSTGEFAPGGLYHNTVGVPGFDGTTAGIPIKFHPDMPLQEQNSLFTFDGTLPPKLLTARYGETLLMRHYNALPIDPSANNGFGIHTVTTHEHNGHNPGESDGYAQAFFFPGQYYDYRWPMELAGYDSINTNASDPRAGSPDGHGGITNVRGDFRETMSTHWFHDHMLDFTAQNVYKGNAAAMNYYSALDRGNEAIDDGVNLRFPSGTALDWGNRDYDVNLLYGDKAWDSDGQLFFNIFNTDGFLGDQVLTNWLYKPTLDVRSRKYRFRMLNGSVSRYFKVAMVTEAGERVPFYLIANDGNIMEHSVYFPDGELPTQSIAERYDIVVDFSQYAPGTRIYLVNLMEHKNGRGPEKDSIPLADVLSGAYNPQVVDGQWEGGDPGVGKFLEIVVREYSGTDLSMDPADYVVGGKTMIELPGFSEQELADATHRSFHFGRANGTDGKPWTIKTDGGTGFGADPRRLTAAPSIGGVEIWHLSTGGGWSHPIHVHFEEGQILSRDGMMPPPWEAFARKDMYRIGPEVHSSRKIDIAFRFREFAGTFVEHCHNTQHEDTAMLMRWDNENPGQTILLPTPMPTWDGVTYVDSHALPTFRTGDADAAAKGVVVPTEPANGGDVNGDGIIDRVFNDDELRAMAPPALELNHVPDMQHILDDFIANKDWAIALGKAFFWDQAVGSDGQACASCHFAAGADNRSKNQLSPGLKNTIAGMDPFSFDTTDTGGGGVNYQLVEGDYPFPKVGSNGLFFDDVAGSQGLSAKSFKRISLRRNKDKCESLPSDFSVAGINHRQVTARNTPTVINAVFNHRNFWDGRANNMFNGVDPLGRRSNLNNPDQGIWKFDRRTRQVTKEQVLIKNASLASQATGPALDSFEMSCAGRTFPLLGKKMLKRRALKKQMIARDDSVLGPYVRPSGKGMKFTYAQMIRRAFKPEYWAARGKVEGRFNQMQANFSLFWGLAIQMYEATLVSHQAPFDAFARGDNTALTEQEKLGLEMFVREDRGHCMACHSGSEFTSASVSMRAEAIPGLELEPGVAEVIGPIERMRMADGGRAVYDGGFYNIGVTQTEMDLCVGADLGGAPLSFSRQAVTGQIVDAEAGVDAVGDDGDFAVPGGPVVIAERIDVDGACKTPTIRNVELTAPYFHNGSHATLEQVTASYMVKFKHLFSDENSANLSRGIFAVDIQGLASDGVSVRGGELDALVAFMKAMTDQRVRLHQAPFDHPELRVPNGSAGSDADGDGIADDDLIVIPAVGVGGLSAPLPEFMEM
ncbi:MAG: multicopper oxidase domain-containing protein [Gammaproteobacteria bacterium]|nr:multicopper oxidase domain-containing protein [Gammaproteobacteria bacterium]